MTDLEERYKVAKWISDEILGRISVEDQQHLVAWRECSGSNEAEYEEIRQRLKKELKTGRLFDPAKEWQDFQRRFYAKKIISRWWYYAAAVAVAGLFSLLWLKHQPEVLPQTPFVAAAGQKIYKALLILDDGQQVSIGDSVSKNISLRRGTIVDSAHIVRYDIQERDTGRLEYNTLVVPRGAEYELCLADGTRVWLNSESRLTYPVQFNGNKRQVQMTGEVCFRVVRNEKKPFLVKAGEVVVTVLGTFFNVEAYPGNRRVVTTLVEGKVKVGQGKKQCILVPGQQALTDDNVMEVKNVVAEDYISWVNGFFHFREASLEEILIKLARWYDIEFCFANPALENAHFSLDIQRYENIAVILSKIEKTGRVRFRVDGKKVTVLEAY